MAVLPIVRMGNPVLRTAAAPVPQETLAEPATQQWIDDMIETMHDADGVGLAAPQVGVAWQLFVYQAEDDEDPAADAPEDRDRRLLVLLSSGCTDEAAAREFGISVRHLRRQVARLMAELGARSRFEAGAEASRRGWL